MRKVNLCIVIAISVLACACSDGNDTATFRRSVYLTQPVQVSGNRVKTYSGIVEAVHEINLGFKTAGQISRICVKEGDYIHKGQLLAELDDADYRLAVEALQVQYDQLTDETKRTKQLFESKSVSANDYEKAVAGLKQLGAQLQANKNKLNYTRLYAPTDGYVQAVNFSRSEMVDAGTSVFQIMDVSHFEVVADIPVSEYLQRKNFTGFYCQTTDGEQKIPMAFLSIVPKADGNQLYRLRLAFTEMSDMKLTAGMNIEVGIDIANNTGVTKKYALTFNVKKGTKVTDDKQNVYGYGVRALTDEMKDAIKNRINAALGQEPQPEFGEDTKTENIYLESGYAIGSVSIQYNIQTLNFDYAYDDESGSVQVQRIVSVLISPEIVPYEFFHGHSHGHGDDANAGGGIIDSEF